MHRVQDLAEPGPDEVRMRVKAACIQPFEGAPRLVYSHDVAGVIDEVGENVTSLHPGEEVWSYLGGSITACSEHLCVPAAAVARKPVNLSFVEAAAIPSIGLAAFEGITRANPGTGQGALITRGGSPLGDMLVQLCRLRGVGTILATSGSERSFRELTQRLQLPADDVIRHHGQTVEELLQLVDSRCQDVQVAFDLVGHHRLSQLCYRSVAFGGSVVTFSDQPSHLSDEACRALFARSASLHVVHTGARARFGESRHWEYYRQTLQTLTEMFERGQLTPPKICEVGEFSVVTLEGVEGLLPRADHLGQLVAAARPHYPAEVVG